MDFNEVIFKIKRHQYEDQNQLLNILSILYDIDIRTLRNYNDEKKLYRYFLRVISPKKIVSFKDVLEDARRIDFETAEKFRSMFDLTEQNSYLKEIFRLLGSNEQINPDLDMDRQVHLYRLLLDLFVLKRNYLSVVEEDLSILTEAFETDNVQMIKAFITNHELGIRFKNYYSENLLFVAARYDAVETFKMFREYGINIFRRNSFKETVLHKALYHNAYQCARFIIRSRILIHRKDLRGNTPLHIAARSNLKIVRMLVERGARLNSKNKNGETPILIAMRYKKPEIVKYLKERRIIIDKNVLYYAARFDAFESFAYITKFRRHYRIIDKHDFTPLHVAAIHNSYHIAELFIEYGMDVNQKTKDALTPLHYAAINNSFDIGRLLIERNAYVNEKDKNDFIPLHYAISNNSDEMIHLLIDAGSDVKIQFKNGFTPLHYATGNNLCELLEKLVAKDVNIDVYNESLFTPLCNAIYFGHIECVKLLIQHGANLNHHVHHPLMVALREKRTEIAKQLIEHGSDVNYIDPAGNTVLHIAKINGLDEMVEIIKEKGDKNA